MFDKAPASSATVSPDMIHTNSSSQGQASKSQFGTGGSGEGSTRGGRRGGGNAKLDYGTVHRDLFTRPEGLDKTGTSGGKITCVANFININSSYESTIYQYHVGFEPEIDSKQMRVEIVRESCKDLIGKHVIFDGMILYSPKQIGDGKGAEVTKSNPITKEAVKVTFRMSVNFGRNDPQTINIYNLLIREAFRSVGFVQVQRNFFDPKRSTTVERYGVEVWPGYETAIRLYEDSFLLCVENRFKVLRTQSVLDQLKAEKKRVGDNVNEMRVNVDHTFTGQTILTLYNNRMHRLTKFAWDMNPNSTFHHAATDRPMSFAQYFQEQYNVTIKDLCQPLIISEGKPKQPGEEPQVTYLVPELCQCTGLTDAMRKDTRTMKVMAEHTRLTPAKRHESTMYFLNQVERKPEIREQLMAWGVDLGRELIDMNCRLLPPEKLYGRNPNAGGYTGRNAEWAKDVRGAGNFRSESLSDWVIVAPDMPEGVQAALKFISECQQLGRAMNMPVEDAFKWVVGGPEATEYCKAVQTAVVEFTNQRGKQPKMVVVVVNDDNKTRYDALKKLVCHDLPVPSQIVKLQTLTGKMGENKNYSSIVLKILLQINCKMGGAIWKVAIPMPDAMIVGYDLYHDSTMQGRTVGAAVSSYDKDFTKWFSQTLPHGNPTELGDNLRTFIKKSLRKYHDANNGTLPERIILYRDGCGDGQIPYVRDTEVRQVKEAAEEVGKLLSRTYTPKLAFTVVTKKVNMRVFKRMGANLVNPDPGTVVDSTVTRPERYDFYLVPQFVNQGTVTPVCYNIIYDDTKLPPDVHQRLAFKLCHLYYNWQGTVRVPAPCQYAHKLAFLVAQSLHKESSDTLLDKLFFL